MSVTAYIGVGSNLGDRAAAIDAAVAAVGRLGGVRLTAVSALYETDPVGPPQPRYLNGAFAVKTDLSAPELLRELLEVERKLGRVRIDSQRSAPRTIDLDLLLHGESVWRDADVEVPHPRMMERAFVLIPLVQIAPKLCHPVTGSVLASAPCIVAATGIALWRPALPSVSTPERHSHSQDLSKGSPT